MSTKKSDMFEVVLKHCTPPACKKKYSQTVIDLGKSLVELWSQCDRLVRRSMHVLPSHKI